MLIRGYAHLVLLLNLASLKVGLCISTKNLLFPYRYDVTTYLLRWPTSMLLLRLGAIVDMFPSKFHYYYRILFGVFWLK